MERDEYQEAFDDFRMAFYEADSGALEWNDLNTLKSLRRKLNRLIRIMEAEHEKAHKAQSH